MQPGKAPGVLLPLNAALIIIDVQKGFDDPSWGTRNNPDAEIIMLRLLTAWRTTGRPVYHVKHMSKHRNSPLRPGQIGNEIKDEVAPRDDEPLVTKNVNSAFIGTNLEEQLKKRGITTLVLLGFTTDHCVSTTARMGANLGFECYVVDDGTATFGRVGYDGKRYAAAEVHSLALASLNEEFAKVVKADTLLKFLL